MKTLVQLVETALGDGDRDWWFPAEGRVIPLSVLWSNAMGMAGRLSRDHGIGPGDRVLVVLENSSDYVSLLLAIWRLGAVAVPIRPYGGRHFWFDAYVADLARIADYRLIVHEPGIPRLRHGCVRRAAGTVLHRPGRAQIGGDRDGRSGSGQPAGAITPLSSSPPAVPGSPRG